ncbi:hypothetical protein [Escherichia coli]
MLSPGVSLYWRSVTINPEEHDELDRLIGHHVKLMSVRNRHRTNG